MITETGSSWKPRWLEGAFWGSCLGWLLAMSSTETRLDTWPQYSNSLPPARGFQSTGIVLKVVFVAAKFVDRSDEWTQNSNINRSFHSFSIAFLSFEHFPLLLLRLPFKVFLVWLSNENRIIISFYSFIYKTKNIKECIKSKRKKMKAYELKVIVKIYLTSFVSQRYGHSQEEKFLVACSQELDARFSRGRWQMTRGVVRPRDA